MKKVLWVLAGLLLAIVAAVVVVPSMIDWNGYKGLIAEEVKKATGRDLTIAGDITVSVLPKPMLVAGQVALSSVDGAQSPDLVALHSVEVRIALAPLLGGKIKVETVRLVEPQVYLEVLADGRTSWTITPPEAPPAGGDVEPKAQGANGGSSGPTVILDQFEIVDGTLIYQDASSGSLEEVSHINLNVAAASLTSGPYQANGSLVARGLRLGIDADVGAIVEGRTFPLNTTLRVGGDSAAVQLVGTVLGLNESPRFRGDLTVMSDNISRIAEAFAPGTALPAPLSQPLKITGGLDASETALAVQNLEIDLGGAKGTGKVSGTLGAAPKIAAEFSIDKIDAEPWMKVTQAPAASAQPANDTAAPVRPASTTTSAPASGVGSFALPMGVSVSLAARVGEIAFNGDSLHNLVLNAQLANGEVTLSQASLQAPGGTDLAVFGSLAARDGKPSFDSSIDLKVRDPHALMTWAGVDASALKAGKPGSLALTGRVGGTPAAVNVRELTLAFDKTTVRGAATIAVRDRLGVGASVAVDQLDLDAYLADASKTPAKPAQAPAATDGATGPASPAPTSEASDTGPFDGLKALTGFDANLHATVGSLKTQGVPIKDVTADLSLVGGTLSIKKFTVGNVAGAGVGVTGAITDLGGMPKASKLAVRAKAADISGLANLVGFTLPVPAKTIGTVEAAADLNGRLDAPTLASSVTTLALKLTANGGLRPLDAANMFDLGVGLKHDDVALLLKRLGTGYTPSGKIGGLDVTSRVKGGPARIDISDLVAVVGAARVGGNGIVDLAGAVPKIDAVLATGDIVVDPFLPAQKSAALDIGGGPARVVPAAFRVEGDGSNALRHLIASVSDRWSPAPVDLSGLKAVDANLQLTSPSVTYHEYKLEGAKLASTLAGGVLKVNEFTGTVFGGQFASTASVDASKARPTLGSNVSVTGMNIGAASAAAGIGGGSGRLTTRAEVTTSGGSIADWIGGLNGGGAIDIKGFKGQQSLSDMPVVGLALGPLMQVFEVLNSGLGSLIGAGGKTGLGETDLTSTFSIANGVIATKDTKIVSNTYSGDITGEVSLPLWSMNVGGNVAIDQGLVGTVIANVVRLPSKIPFQVSGNIDKPNVKIQSFSGSTSQGGSGITVPGLEKLEKKAPGVGTLLQGILGGGSSTQQGTTGSTGSAAEPPSQTGSSGTTTEESSPPAQEQPTQQKDPINQLLRGLIR